VEASLQHEAKATAHGVRDLVVLLKQPRSVCCGKNCPDAVKFLILWRPRRDLNPPDYKMAR